MEARDDDEFLAWLNSLKIPQPSALADHPTSASSGSGDTSTGADERNRVKQFFSDAEKRLSGFVAFKEDMLFRDRESRRETDRDKEAPARVEVGVTAGKKATYLPKLPEEELYQVCVGVGAWERAAGWAGGCLVEMHDPAAQGRELQAALYRGVANILLRVTRSRGFCHSCLGACCQLCLSKRCRFQSWSRSYGLRIISAKCSPPVGPSHFTAAYVRGPRLRS